MTEVEADLVIVALSGILECVRVETVQALEVCLADGLARIVLVSPIEVPEVLAVVVDEWAGWYTRIQLECHGWPQSRAVRVASRIVWLYGTVLLLYASDQH